MQTGVPQAPHSPTSSASDRANTAPGRAGLGAAVLSFSAITLLSRIGGLARDLLLVRVFDGASAVGSAFLAAFAVPNMFRRLFGEGALSAAFIPEYAQAVRADPARADRLGSLTLLALLLITGAITVIAEAALLALLLVAPGNPARALSLQLLMLMLPFMPLVCAAAILGGMLQVHGRFGPSASGPLILNAFIIATGVYALATGQIGGTRTAFVLGAATMASGLTQCLWFLRLLRPHVRWTRDFSGAGEAARRMLGRFVPVMIGMGTLQINAFLDTLLAAWPIWVGPTMLGIAYPMDEKSTSVLAFTQRLYQFPLGVFGIAVATAVFPLLSRHHDDAASFAAILRRGIRLSVFIGLPAALGLMLVRRDLVAALFSGRNGFDAADLERSAAVLLGFAPGVWAYSLNHVLTRAFYARGDTRTPMRVAIAMVVLNLALNLGLIWQLREAGLAWATTISATAQCAVLALLTRRLLGAPLLDSATAKSLVTTALAAAVMAGAVLAMQAMLPAPVSWATHTGALFAACLIGVAVYAVVAWRLGSAEVRWLLKTHEEPYDAQE